MAKPSRGPLNAPDRPSGAGKPHCPRGQKVSRSGALRGGTVPSGTTPPLGRSITLPPPRSSSGRGVSEPSRRRQKTTRAGLAIAISRLNHSSPVLAQLQAQIARVFRASPWASCSEVSARQQVRNLIMSGCLSAIRSGRNGFWRENFRVYVPSVEKLVEVRMLEGSMQGGRDARVRADGGGDRDDDQFHAGGGEGDHLHLPARSAEGSRAGGVHSDESLRAWSVVRNSSRESENQGNAKGKRTPKAIQTHTSAPTFNTADYHTARLKPERDVLDGHRNTENSHGVVECRCECGCGGTTFTHANGSRELVNHSAACRCEAHREKATQHKLDLENEEMEAYREAQKDFD